MSLVLPLALDLRFSRPPVSLEQVSFAYKLESPPVLQDINLSI